MIKNSNIYDNIISPIVTEKSTNQSELNKIVFKVNKNFNKNNIKKNIEKIFKVEVIKVNIVNKKNLHKGNAFKLYSSIESFTKLKKKYNWGTNIYYHFAANHNCQSRKTYIHMQAPTSVQPQQIKIILYNNENIQIYYLWLRVNLFQFHNFF